MTTLDTTDRLSPDPVHAGREAPWEPTLVGTEAAPGAVDRLRWTFDNRPGGLDVAGLETRVGSSNLSLAGRPEPLVLVEKPRATGNLDSGHYAGPWGQQGADHSGSWDVRTGSADEPIALDDRVVSRAHATVSGVVGDGGRVGDDPPPGQPTVARDSAVWHA